MRVGWGGGELLELWCDWGCHWCDWYAIGVTGMFVFVANCLGSGPRAGGGALTLSDAKSGGAAWEGPHR